MFILTTPQIKIKYRNDVNIYFYILKLSILMLICLEKAFSGIETRFC